MPSSPNRPPSSSSPNDSSKGREEEGRGGGRRAGDDSDDGFGLMILNDFIIEFIVWFCCLTSPFIEEPTKPEVAFFVSERFSESGVLLAPFVDIL